MQRLSKKKKDKKSQYCISCLCFLHPADVLRGEGDILSHSYDATVCRQWPREQRELLVVESKS